MLSPRGRSHSFDSRADGYARGEACCATALRAAASADAAGSRLCGVAVRQDGRSASLTAPNGQAQQGVLGASLADAQVEASEVGVLEAHGTGTALGDPIEAGSMAAAVLAHRDGSSGWLGVGSLKANAGHTEPGAGLAGALKLLMQLQDASMSPNAQLRVLNPHVGGGMRQMRSVMPCQGARVTGAPVSACGGLSSFGYAGTIAHVVLRQSPGDGAPTDSALPLIYRRGRFPWREVVRTADAGRTSMHAVCWVRASPADGAAGVCLLLAVDMPALAR